MITQNDFTFGFELEGAFKQDLINSLWGSGLDVECKDDCSVNAQTNLFEPATQTREDDNGSEYEEEISEVNLGIFDNFSELVKWLKKFKNGTNYVSNSSCGLHIHIKPRENDVKMQMFDENFIDKLQKYAMTLCNCVQDRVKNNHFCMPAESLRQKMQFYRLKTKYAFMGNHPQGTIEFRFFSACEHKTENVKRFFEYFFEEINKVKTIFSKDFKYKPVIELEYNNMGNTYTIMARDNIK